MPPGWAGHGTVSEAVGLDPGVGGGLSPEDLNQYGGFYICMCWQRVKRGGGLCNGGQTEDKCPPSRGNGLDSSPWRSGSDRLSDVAGERWLLTGKVLGTLSCSCSATGSPLTCPRPPAPAPPQPHPHMQICHICPRKLWAQTC